MDRKRLKGLFVPAALTPDGWISDTSIYFDAHGVIERLEPGLSDSLLHRAKGPVVPGMTNLHSHAFQRAMTGRTHSFTSADDNFWSWRASMYDFVEEMGPEDLESLATGLYADMLAQGYTSVCEFHYVHHDPSGNPYTDPAEMSKAIVRAARTSGIGLTLLPVLYRYGGFGGIDIGRGQRRFFHTVDDYLKLVEILTAESEATADFVLGYAPHSLRAIDPEDIGLLVQHRSATGAGRPMHIHISEQMKEVEDCLSWCGKRPVEWLIDNAPIDENWCLVHSTHVTADELDAVARTGAVVGLCPTTEADLGDGVFPFREFLRRGGVYGIGSDSNVSTSPSEEIRLLEYIQRAYWKTRNISGQSSKMGAGTLRYLEALQGGRQASGMKSGRLESGSRADLLVLDASHRLLEGKSPDEMLNAHLFSGGSETIQTVIVRGHAIEYSLK